MAIDSEILTLLPYFIPRILVATACGAIIGIDREFKLKVAGIRTFILICVGSSILTAISYLISKQGNSDPTRIIGQIITGIGFLGVGVIFKSEDKVIGVTTSAFIWVVSAIGILSGIGAIWTPIILTFGLLIVSLLFEKVESVIKKLKSNKNGN
jgi:putative Mg2+ transporter-C (MgtC) family protein